MPVSAPSEDDEFGVDSFLKRIETEWEGIPNRFRIVLFCSAAFMLCNMDKVNLSLAIIPMAREFGWKASTAGMIQSSFFWGYMAFQLPGGFLCSRYGGRKMIPYAVGIWSLATASVSFVQGSVGGLCLARAAVGFGEAIAPSAITDMVSRTVPISERSRATSFIFAGLSVGSVVGLFLSSFLIENINWESVFLLFGISGALWIVGFEGLMDNFTENDFETTKKLSTLETASDKAVPVRAILRSKPVWALTFTHFCGNYFSYTMLTWLPSFFTQTLDLNIGQTAVVSVIPPILSITFAGVAGTLADKLIEKGWETSTVRKISQSISFLGSSMCLLGASISDNPVQSAAFVALSLGLSAFSMAGLYCNHGDLSPKYSSFLLGFTNTAASIPGIVGVWLTGYLFDQWGRWDLALFYPCIFFKVIGLAGFIKFGSAQLQAFDNNEPFEIEKILQKRLSEWRT